MFSNLIKGFLAWKRLGLIGNPALWSNARMVFADVPVEADVVREWVPFPVRLIKPATATVFIAHYPETVFGDPYHEVGIMLKVKLFGIFPMLHCPWMLVDDDRHLIQGREMLGYPKKMATFRFEEKDGKFFGSAERRGHEVFRFEGTIGAPIDNPAPGVGQWWVNTRNLMTFFPGHLVTFRPTEKIHKANRMELKITITPNENDPLCRVIGPAQAATIRTCDIGANLWIPPLRVFPVGPGFIAKMMHLRAA